MWETKPDFFIKTIYVLLYQLAVIGIIFVFYLLSKFNAKFKLFLENKAKRRITNVCFMMGISILNSCSLIFYDTFYFNIVIMCYIATNIIVLIYFNYYGLINCVGVFISVMIYAFVMYSKYDINNAHTTFMSLLVIVVYAILFLVAIETKFNKLWQFCIIYIIASGVSAAAYYVMVHRYMSMFLYWVLFEFLVFIVSKILFDTFYKVINNILDINDLTIYQTENYYNYKYAYKMISKKQFKNNMLLNCSIYINKVNCAPEYTIEVVNKLNSFLRNFVYYKVKKYNPIFFINKFGLISFVLEIKDNELSNDLSNPFAKQNKILYELKQLLSKIDKYILIDGDKVPLDIKFMFSIIGSQIQSIQNVDDINKIILMRHKNDKKTNFILFDPILHEASKIETINLNNIGLEKSKIKLSIDVSNVRKSWLELNVLYMPNLIFNRIDFINFIKTQDKYVDIFRYLSYETLKLFQKEDDKKLILDYPYEQLTNYHFDYQAFKAKINELELDPDDIIIRIKVNYKKQDFGALAQNILILKSYKFRIWLEDVDEDSVWLLEQTLPEYCNLDQTYVFIDSYNKFKVKFQEYCDSKQITLLNTTK